MSHYYLYFSPFFRVDQKSYSIKHGAEGGIKSMGSYDNPIYNEARYLIDRFWAARLGDIERQIRDTQRRITFLEIHRDELVTTKLGRREMAKFMVQLNKLSEPEKLALRFKVKSRTTYWLEGASPPRETEAEVRAFPASLRLKPRQEQLEAWRKTQTPTEPVRLSHKPRLLKAAPAACADCPTRETLAQLKRSMAACGQMYGIDM